MLGEKGASEGDCLGGRSKKGGKTAVAQFFSLEKTLKKTAKNDLYREENYERKRLPLKPEIGDFVIYTHKR